MQSTDANIVRSGARPTMQGAKCVSSLVYTLVCLRARLLGTACLENGFVDNVARVHGCTCAWLTLPDAAAFIAFSRGRFSFLALLLRSAMDLDSCRSGHPAGSGLAR